MYNIKSSAVQRLIDIILLNISTLSYYKRAGDTHPEIGKAKETRDTSIRTCPVKPTRKKNKRHSMRNLLGVLKP